MAKAMVSFIEEKEKLYSKFVRYLDLVNTLAMRDVKMRYQLSILGLYWAILNPFLVAIIWSIVFNKIFRFQGIEGVPYIIFIFCGITFWNLFANSLTTAVNSLTGNASLLSKLYFPRLILPSASVMARVVDFLFSFAVLCILMLVYHVTPGQRFYWLPLLLLIQLIFTLGMAYIVSSLNVIYRDISQILGLVLMLWLYVSPILYTMQQVPEHIRKYFMYNPIGELVYMGTNILIGNGEIDLLALIVATFMSVGVFVCGLILFRYLEPVFAEVM